MKHINLPEYLNNLNDDRLKNHHMISVFMDFTICCWCYVSDDVLNNIVDILLENHNRLYHPDFFIWHHDSQPAYKDRFGEEQWYENNMVHRLTGAAIIIDGSKEEWCVFDKIVDKDKLFKWYEDNDIDPYSITEEEKLFLSMAVDTLI